MAYNHHNGSCHQCSKWVYKGDGLRIFVNGWVTMCRPCGIARTTNKSKAVSKKAYIKRQPTLFD